MRDEGQYEREEVNVLVLSDVPTDGTTQRPGDNVPHSLHQLQQGEPRDTQQEEGTRICFIDIMEVH